MESQPQYPEFRNNPENLHPCVHACLKNDFTHMHQYPLCWPIFCLFDFILYVPVNNFSVMLGRVFLGWTSTKQG